MARGRPFTLRCPKCKAGEDYREPRSSCEMLYSTGETLIAAKKGYRYHVRVWLVWHGPCGWAFWTDHLTARSLPVKQPRPSVRIPKPPKAAPPGATSFDDEVTP